MAQEVCLRGLIIPKEWHRNGRVKSLALATNDEKEISISNPMQIRIIRHLRQQVEVWGIFEDPACQTIFQVTRLKPCGPPRD